MQNTILNAAKAIIAAAVAFAGTVATGYVDGAMTAGEWWLAASAGLVSLGAVYGVPNAPKPKPVAPDHDQRPDTGHTPDTEVWN